MNSNCDKLKEFLASYGYPTILETYCTLHGHPSAVWRVESQGVQSRFFGQVVVGGVTSKVMCASKKADAKRLAAWDAYKTFLEMGEPFFVQQKPDNVSLLNALCQALGFPTPKYISNDAIRVNGALNFKENVECQYKVYQGEAFHPNKKEAKSDAANVALNLIAEDPTILMKLENSHPEFSCMANGVPVNAIVSNVSDTSGFLPPLASNLTFAHQQLVLKANDPAPGTASAADASKTSSNSPPSTTRYVNSPPSTPRQLATTPPTTTPSPNAIPRGVLGLPKMDSFSSNPEIMVEEAIDYTGLVDNLAKDQVVYYPLYSYRTSEQPTGLKIYRAQLMVNGKTFVTTRPHLSQKEATNEVCHLFLQADFPHLV